MGITRDWESSYAAFRDHFLKQRTKDLQRISKETRGEMTPEDLEGAAWLIADEIEKKRGREVNFADSEDQGLVIAWLRSEFVNFTEKKIRNGRRLGREREDSDGDLYASSLLPPALPESDPLTYFLRCESTMERMNVQKKLGYSQATAYFLLSFQYAGNVRDVSSYLAIQPQTFRSRLRWFVDFVKVQPSLYDKTEVLDPNYMPPPGRRYSINRAVPSATGQINLGLTVRGHTAGGWRRLLVVVNAFIRFVAKN